MTVWIVYHTMEDDTSVSCVHADEDTARACARATALSPAYGMTERSNRFWCANSSYNCNSISIQEFDLEP